MCYEVHLCYITTFRSTDNYMRSSDFKQPVIKMAKTGGKNSLKGYGKQNTKNIPKNYKACTRMYVVGKIIFLSTK